MYCHGGTTILKILEQVGGPHGLQQLLFRGRILQPDTGTMDNISTTPKKMPPKSHARSFAILPSAPAKQRHTVPRRPATLVAHIARTPNGKAIAALGLTRITRAMSLSQVLC